VQDIVAVAAMTVLGSSENPGHGAGDVVVLLGMKLPLAAASVFVLMRYVLPPLTRMMARSQELLLIFAIAWGTALAALGEWAGFSKEAGAFLAGFSLASTHYRDAMSARLTGIRDFLLLFFFIDLGAKLDFSTLGGELWPAVLLSVFVLIGNPLIVMAIMGYMGYRKRTGFLAGLTVAQISEFSIIFVAMGISLGHVGQDALGLTTLVGVVTIALSTYMILYSQPLYERLAPWLSVFERKHPQRELAVEQRAHGEETPRVIVFGLGRYGARLLERLHAQGMPALGVDFDPETVRGLRRKKLIVHFGDAEDPAFLESLPLAGVDWIVTTLPEWSANRMLLHALRDTGFKGRVAGVVRDESHGRALHEAGVARVINPFSDAADHAAEALAQDVLSQEKTP